MLPLLWETDDQGHVITRVIDIAFCSRQNPAVVGIIKNDRVVTDARFIEFLNPSANLLIHRRNDVHVGHPVLTKFSGIIPRLRRSPVLFANRLLS